MRPSDAERAVRAACRIASSLGLDTDDTVVLHDSNKLTLRLLPCDVLARVAPVDDQVAQFELGLARRLVEAGAPVAAPAPEVGRRVYEHDGFTLTLWTYHPPSGNPIPPSAYSDALAHLHASLRQLDAPAPHFSDRIAEARSLLADPARTPDLAAADRELLSDTLRRLGRQVGEYGADEQLLHGEPHPGNVLATKAAGPLFVDLETVCRGPVEFDLAHAPDVVADHYPGVDHALLDACRTLALAIATTWRWDRDDGFPDGRRIGREWLSRLSGRRGRT